MLDVIARIPILDGSRFFLVHLIFVLTPAKIFSFGKKYYFIIRYLIHNIEKITFNSKISYAVLDGNGCLCTHTINESELKDEECDRPCSENHLEFCGGEYSQSYFDTNQRVPGPSRNLKMIKRTENTILIQWNRPEQASSLNQYIIRANFLKKFGSKILPPLPQWTIESIDNTVQYELLNLSPGKIVTFFTSNGITIRI